MKPGRIYTGNEKLKKESYWPRLGRENHLYLYILATCPSLLPVTITTRACREYGGGMPMMSGCVNQMVVSSTIQVTILNYCIRIAWGDGYSLGIFISLSLCLCILLPPHFRLLISNCQLPSNSSAAAQLLASPKTPFPWSNSHQSVAYFTLPSRYFARTRRRGITKSLQPS